MPILVTGRMRGIRGSAETGALNGLEARTGGDGRGEYRESEGSSVPLRVCDSAARTVWCIILHVDRVASWRTSNLDSAARLREQQYQRSVATLADEESWSLARRLAEGESGCCDALMARLGSPPPEMIWNPQPDILESEALRHLAVWWMESTADAGGDGAPTHRLGGRHHHRRGCCRRHNIAPRCAERTRRLCPAPSNR